MIYDIEHITRYRYSDPVRWGRHRVALQPRQTGRQRVMSHSLRIDPKPSKLDADVDAMGNTLHRFELCSPHEQLTLRANCRVQVPDRPAAVGDAGRPWPEVVELLDRMDPRGADPSVALMRYGSPLVPLAGGGIGRLLEVGRRSMARGSSVARAAVQLMHQLHRELAYEPGVTTVSTPVDDVLEHRRGVCQDFAHLMIAVLRAYRLPARYVSGYVRTGNTSAGDALVGADASHAWVGVWVGDEAVGDAGWLDLDPTNDLVVGPDHVSLAVGRDYGDVTPVKGVILGGGQHEIAVAVRVSRAGSD